MSGAFGTIEEAVAAIAAGQPVVVVDDADRENEGDLIFAAELATPELMAFMVRHTSGFVCAPLTEADADRLELPPMYHTNQDRRGTAYTLPRDEREGGATGPSGADPPPHHPPPPHPAAAAARPARPRDAAAV